MSPDLATDLCRLLSIEVPVVQAPMAGVTTPEMVAAVGNAGGMGILGSGGTPPEELRRQIRRVRELTDRPFGANLVLHSQLHPPTDAATIPEAVVEEVQAQLNRFRRRLGLPEKSGRPPNPPHFVDEAFRVILEERVPVFSIGLGKPTPEMGRACRQHGIRILAMAATVADAVELAASGVDAVVAQGGEAGGHRSTWVKPGSPGRGAIGLMVLLPQVVAAVSVPVLAAGGIMDGRGVVAALALGASGVFMGTRFVATHESAASEAYKAALIASDSDSTTLSDAFTGLYARMLRNTLTEEYAASGAPVFPAPLQQAALEDVRGTATARGDGEFFPRYTGQGVGMIRGREASGEVVRGVVAEAREVLAALARRAR
jgi:nitronate monooxygenase